MENRKPSTTRMDTKMIRAGLPLLPMAILSLGFLLQINTPLSAQHCPAIVESYLSEISVKHQAQTPELKVDLLFSKSGGRNKKAYQAYLLLVPAENHSKLLASIQPKKPIIDEKVVAVLSTQVIEQNGDGDYPYKLLLPHLKIVKRLDQLLPNPKADAPDATSGRLPLSYTKFKLVLFIPFLEDERYSTLPGLPADRHECNYQQHSALLFQTLPYTFTLYGRQDGELKGNDQEAEYAVWITGAEKSSDEP